MLFWILFKDIKSMKIFVINIKIIFVLVIHALNVILDFVLCLIFTKLIPWKLKIHAPKLKIHALNVILDFVEGYRKY